MAAQVANALRRLGLGLGDSLPQLPVSLTIELVSSDEYCATFLSRVEQD